MYVEGSVGFSLGWEIGFGLVYRSTLIGVGAFADKGTFRRFPSVTPRALLLPSQESRRTYFGEIYGVRTA